MLSQQIWLEFHPNVTSNTKSNEQNKMVHSSFAEILRAPPPQIQNKDFT